MLFSSDSEDLVHYFLGAGRRVGGQGWTRVGTMKGERGAKIKKKLSTGGLECIYPLWPPGGATRHIQAQTEQSKGGVAAGNLTVLQKSASVSP